MDNKTGIEWDDTKRDQTLRERGLDFADIADVDWSAALTIEDLRQPYSETRYVTIAPVKGHTLRKGRLCVFAWCHRGSNIRVISLRKANRREEKRYAKNQAI